MCSSGLEALSGPFSTKFLKSTDLRFTTSPAIATYTLLPPVLPCLPWFVGLFVAVIFIVFCRAVGHFLKFLFSCVAFASSFKSFGVALACGAFKCACKMHGLSITRNTKASKIYQINVTLIPCFLTPISFKICIIL